MYVGLDFVMSISRNVMQRGIHVIIGRSRQTPIDERSDPQAASDVYNRQV